MSGMDKGKRPRKRVCAESFLSEIREEVGSSLVAEEQITNAYREMASIKLTLDGIKSISPKVLRVYISVAFEAHVVYYVSRFLSELRLLPVSLRVDTIQKVAGISAEEAELIFEACSITSEFCQSSLRREEQHFEGIGYPMLLSPPTATCLSCSTLLTKHNKPCEVNVHSLRGRKVGLKFSLRCERCKLNYNYDRYGNQTQGWRLYEERRPLVEASDVCFVDRKLLDFQCALANHSWVSFSGFSTAYEEVFQLLGKEGEGYGEKQCSSAFWNGELENELRELGSLDFFGLLKKNEDREKVMVEVDNYRSKSVYTHTPEDCSDACKARGCGKLWVLDGQWKLMFAHCMMQRKNFVRGLPLVNYPNVCTNSPLPRKAFCDEHVAYLNEKHPTVPTGIREFLEYCGIQNNKAGKEEETIEELQEADVSKVAEVISSLTNDNEVSHVGTSALETQGTSEFIEKQETFNSVLNDCTEKQPTMCNKDTGLKQRLQKWSRGHLFIVRGGGIIDKWSPLFKSEGPAQVFIIVLSWLFVILKGINPVNWAKIFVAYDNMCHLDGMKASKNPLPLSSPWDKAWISVTKIIDSLHIRNHKDTSCREKYNPDMLKKELPDGNTMAAEQTFVWLSRFKKILCAMPKVHHLFYLHRMVKRRNMYTIQCYKHGKKPLLPKARREK